MHTSTVLSEDLIDLCKQTLSTSKYNWFQLHEAMEEVENINAEAVLDQFFLNLDSFDFQPSQLKLIVQSRQAYKAAQCDACGDERAARAINGLIVTDSESDDPEQYVGLHNPLSEQGRSLIAKRRKTIQRRARRLKAKAIADAKLLSPNSGKRVSKILNECKVEKKLKNLYQSAMWVRMRGEGLAF